MCHSHRAAASSTQAVERAREEGDGGGVFDGLDEASEVGAVAGREGPKQRGSGLGGGDERR